MRWEGMGVGFRWSQTGGWIRRVKLTLRSQGGRDCRKIKGKLCGLRLRLLQDWRNLTKLAHRFSQHSQNIQVNHFNCTSAIRHRTWYFIRASTDSSTVQRPFLSHETHTSQRFYRL